jgi:hypothetical protein
MQSGNAIEDAIKERNREIAAVKGKQEINSGAHDRGKGLQGRVCRFGAGR